MANFKFKQFEIQQDRCAMKIGTDGVLLGAWANVAQASSILDIGTGTGILSLMAAQRNHNAVIDALEIEEKAFEQASLNIQNSPWKERITVYHRSVQNHKDIDTYNYYDCIICNPPFYNIDTKSHIKDKARNIARNSKTLSFDALLECTKNLLEVKGSLSLILPIAEGNEFIFKALSQGFFLTKKTVVIPRVGKAPNRFLLEFRLSDSKTIENKLTIRNEGKKYHDYTDAYIHLHKDFYLFL
ncbi:MAG: methyltransferase [Saprospiraceae bacterium]|nr:methyltransferase [Saprospiraceae bacterium]